MAWTGRFPGSELCLFFLSRRRSSPRLFSPEEDTCWLVPHAPPPPPTTPLPPTIQSVKGLNWTELFFKDYPAPARQCPRVPVDWNVRLLCRLFVICGVAHKTPANQWCWAWQGCSVSKLGGGSGSACGFHSSKKPDASQPVMDHS